MKKIFRTLAATVICIAAVIACAFAVGCQNSGDAKSDYNFTIVYEDTNKPLNGQKDGHMEGGKVFTQICIPGQSCYPLTGHDIYPDANGKLSLSQKQVNEILQSETDVTVFVLHVLHIEGYQDDCEVTTTNGKGDYTLVIKK